MSAADGTKLHITDYLLLLSAARGSVVIMHGLGEHSGRYRHVAQFLNDCGLSVRCYDHRGHGRSEGKRGDVINGDPVLQDAEIMIDDFAANFDEPPFLFGESMGGAFAAHLALARRSRLRGLILSSPALSLRLTAFQQTLLKIMQMAAPSFAVPSGLQSTYLSHDPQVAATYRADPLVHGRISARLLRSMLSSIDYCQANAGALTIPALLLVAGDDHLVDAEGSKRFHAKLPVGMARMHVYPDFYHEIFNELGAQRVFEDLRAWLDHQLASS